GDDTDADSFGLHDLRKFVDVTDAYPAEHRADLGLVDVDDSGDRKAALTETVVSGECLSEVAGADDHHRPVVGKAEFASNLIHEIRDLVADAARAVAAEVAQVLSNLRGIDTAQSGEPLGRDAVDAFVALLGEDSEVDGESGNGGIWDAS